MSARRTIEATLGRLEEKLDGLTRDWGRRIAALEARPVPPPAGTWKSSATTITAIMAVVISLSDRIFR